MSFRTLSLLALVALILTRSASARADDFFCSSGDVACLIAAINSANARPGEHVINLQPGIYTLETAVVAFGFGTPAISGSIKIQATGDDRPTIIERDPAAPPFGIFFVSASGELTMSGLTIQRSDSTHAAIFNQGILSLQDCVITNNINAFQGTIDNAGTLHVLRTIVTDNGTGNVHDAGGILNEVGGIALIEFSTIAHNVADGSGGILNQGAMVVRNSSIIFNASTFSGNGAGISNFGGNLEIINSTVAKNIDAASVTLGGRGGGIANFLGGFVSITSSTIRENEVRNGFPGGGILNSGGTTALENTIVAGNTISNPFGVVTGSGVDCSGTVTSIGSNLFGDPSGCTVNLQPSDLTGSPGLGSLVGTEEEALPGHTYYPVLAGSPVIDKGNPNACPQVDQLGNPRVGICDIGAIEFREPVLASVDIRPKSDANRINPNSNQNINVAILTVNGFDATTIDAKSVRFGATGAEAAPIHTQTRDADGNGSRDLILRFQIPDTGIKCGDTSASLTGQTFSGLSFIGSSPIKTVQCGKTH